MSLRTHGQSAYTYNDMGACTSRTKPSSPAKFSLTWCGILSTAFAKGSPDKHNCPTWPL